MFCFFTLLMVSYGIPTFIFQIFHFCGFTFCLISYFVWLWIELKAWRTHIQKRLFLINLFQYDICVCVFFNLFLLRYLHNKNKKDIKKRFEFYSVNNFINRYCEKTIWRIWTTKATTQQIQWSELAFDANGFFLVFFSRENKTCFYFCEFWQIYTIINKNL